jgi:hypothetical protein
MHRKQLHSSTVCNIIKFTNICFSHQINQSFLQQNQSFSNYLEEEDKAHPLIVGVVLLSVVVAEVVGDTRGRNVRADLPLEGVGHGEGAGDPAVRVDDMGGQSTDDALDRVANELVGGDDEGTGEQQHRGEKVVQTEDGIVGGDLLPLEIVLQSSK